MSVTLNRIDLDVFHTERNGFFGQFDGRHLTKRKLMNTKKRRRKRGAKGKDKTFLKPTSGPPPHDLEKGNLIIIEPNDVNSFFPPCLYGASRCSSRTFFREKVIKKRTLPFFFFFFFFRECYFFFFFFISFSRPLN